MYLCSSSVLQLCSIKFLRSKLGAVQAPDSIEGGGGVTHNPILNPDSAQSRGLALLPIVAILCGVALGLGTLGLGIILLVRRSVTAGRRRRGCDSSNSSFSAGSPATYDAVPGGGGGGASARSTLSTSEHFVMKGEPFRAAAT